MNMIKTEKVAIDGWEAAIRGMRNPMNSWDKSDSQFRLMMNNGVYTSEFEVGENDLTLMKSLVKAGSDHSKFMRMINVTMDITAPLYFWKEFDTHKVGTVRDSCSTMHKIADKEFELDDFSHEKLINSASMTAAEQEVLFSPIQSLATTIGCLNAYRDLYLQTKDKKYWWQMIQLLPSSYNQKATVQLNYAVLRNMYHSRKNHKLDEWVDFCKMIETLPYNELITI